MRNAHREKHIQNNRYQQTLLQALSLALDLFQARNSRRRDGATPILMLRVENTSDTISDSAKYSLI